MDYKDLVTPPSSTSRASIYVHFPYCLEKCPYCDFVSYKVERSDIDHRAYTDAIIAELEHRARGLAAAGTDYSIASVFFGGGTPSLWEPSQLARVVSRAKELFKTSRDLEITVECNPTSLDEDRAQALASASVNRLSIGTQSLEDEQLKYLGRLHDAGGAVRAIRDAQRSKIERISTDLIFGLPNQAPENAAAQAGKLADLGLTHLSCYQLTIEPGTRFGELARRGRLPLADDGHVAAGFLAIDEALADRGFVHYEISNYAKPGEEARHNLGYWRGEDYVAVGCGAYGCVSTPNGKVRYRNDADPGAYVAAASTERSDGDPAAGVGAGALVERLPPETLMKERIMLGLRLMNGFNMREAGEALGVDPWPLERRQAAETLVSRGRLRLDGDAVSIPKSGWLYTDDTAARLF